ncbi:glycosyltransferase [Fischerella thermalis]|jgi:dolichol-phosphate mannosyltransferase|uniref:Dolichol-phosphate mannosyltransferase n=3 Tax=Fischerella TaxID=1190 RepID=G6FN21_9CYAN|nr:glycosyltransferase [Fischerella thermalis]PMB04651.1 sulfonate ABC transporter permease [Fischerella thermalis CCMEE 5273]EHC19451.1 Dolichyl-phosphate beta-D-mannosyltransferase [Fischerella thermalis JSC-11]PLZ05963.1 sulfonate ABC transporter permease [Fischerella thermalis WC114]PLZ11086.1 sulfonate ABC transporter permease [Fischerella thermalis WC1110]PLZ13338.1 sulfonate ABC transporter permease [Fischerella thermalis WC119]
MNINQPSSLLPVPSGTLQIPESPSQELVWFSLIIPTYNEAANIEKLIQRLTNLLDERIPGNYELIVVDDNSPDGTWQIAQSLIQKYPQLQVMRRQDERGLSSAVIRGWQVAKGTILGVIDGDLQHPPHVLLQLLDAIIKGADLAVASRHIDGGGVSSWSLIRRFLSRGAQVLGLIILPSVVGRVSDPMSGYFLVRRQSIANVTLNPVGYKILLEVIGRGQIKQIAEVGYVFCERKQGESKVTWKQYLEYIHHLLRLQFSTGHIGKFSQNFPVGRFVRFGLVGLSGVFVDMAVLYLLSDPTTLGLPLTRSKIIAGEIAIFNNFLWNDAWTFADVAMQQNSWRQRCKRFLKFNIICLAGLVLNVLVLNLVFNFLIRNRYVANLIAIAIATVWNFWVNLKLSWRVTQVK